MDTYSRALVGSRSRVSGEYFEGMISAACQFYEEKGISVIEKTPEPMRVLKPYDRKRGQFICCFAKQAQPDFKGILMDATMVLFDAKHTDKERIMRDVVTEEQENCFERYMKLGGDVLLGGINRTGQLLPCSMGGLPRHEKDLRSQIHGQKGSRNI